MRDGSHVWPTIGPGTTAIWMPQEKQREESRASNQAVLLRAGALDVLLGLALASGGVPSPAVRTQVGLLAQICVSANRRWVLYSKGHPSASHCRQACALLQALHCLERLLAGAPKAQLALMTASLPLPAGGTLPALQVRSHVLAHKVAWPSSLRSLQSNAV